MKLLRLALQRYGHLSDCVLEFGDGLSVVLGANEAGKSTALAALADGLFGFPHRSHYDFLHAGRDLRVGLLLADRAGPVAGFVRRKGNRDTLADEDGTVVPDRALLPFLGGATRERFEKFYGLDAAELRSGGDAILRGEGEVGEAILQAHTGMSGFRAVLERLGEDAGKLFGDRRGNREFNVVVKGFHESRARLERCSVRAADWKETDAALRALEETLRADAAERAELERERARLERIRRTAPLLPTLRRSLAERADLGEVPHLPPDADARRLAALAARDRAALELQRETDGLEQCAADLAGLVVDHAVLDDAAAIDELAADLNADLKTRRDRERQRIVAAQARRRAEDSGAALGVSRDAAALAASVPDAVRRDAAQRALAAVLTRAERRRLAEAALREASAEAATAREAVAALADPPDAAALRLAIEAARGEGRIDADLAEAASRTTAAEKKLARRMAELPGWTRDAAELAAAPVPLAAEISRAAAALETAGRTVAETREALGRHDRMLAELEATLAALARGGEVPSDAAVAALRARRDAAWGALRARLATGAPPADLPDAFEGLLRTADALADRRITEADRVARHEEARGRAEEETRQRTATAERLAAAEAALMAAQTAWRGLWQGAGVGALAPDSMQDWLRRRDEALAAADTLDDAERRRAVLAERRQAARMRLLDLLGEESGEGDLLAAVLRVAEARCAAMDQTATAHDRAVQAMREAERAEARATTALAQADAASREAQEAWGREALRLGLPAEAEAASGQKALELWQAVATAVRDWRDAEDRVAEMTAAIEAFAEAKAAAVRRAAPDLAAATPEDAVRVLASRLAVAREALRRRDDLVTRQTSHAAAAALQRTTHEGAEAGLAGLRALAGAADDTALAEAIGRAGNAAELDRRIAGLRAELERVGDGHDLAALEHEAASAELDALPGRIETIVARQQEIAQRNVVHGTELERLRSARAAMEAGQDAAGAAQEMQQSLAEIDDIAQRYVRLRVAERLLRAGIDRFRRQQQAPLLTRAGALFARLTEDRYSRLDVEESDGGKLLLAAIRPDGTRCPAERLSEGTRDQLYLALRLAAIEGHAAVTDPLPFVADDLLVNFDDRRAAAALRVLAEFSAVTQVILFTHHGHVAEMAAGLARVQALPGDLPVAA